MKAPSPKPSDRGAGANQNFPYSCESSDLLQAVGITSPNHVPIVQKRRSEYNHPRRRNGDDTITVNIMAELTPR